MGLGKTLQMISFVDCFLRYTKGRRVLIIVPVNTLQNWAHEFDQWVPSKGNYFECTPSTMITLDQTKEWILIRTISPIHRGVGSAKGGPEKGTVSRDAEQDIEKVQEEGTRRKRETTAAKRFS